MMKFNPIQWCWFQNSHCSWSGNRLPSLSSTGWTDHLQDSVTGSGINLISVLTAMGPDQISSEPTSTEIELGIGEPDWVGPQSGNWIAWSLFLQGTHLTYLEVHIRVDLIHEADHIAVLLEFGFMLMYISTIALFRLSMIDWLIFRSLFMFKMILLLLSEPLYSTYPISLLVPHYLLQFLAQIDVDVSDHICECREELSHDSAADVGPIHARSYSWFSLALEVQGRDRFRIILIPLYSSSRTGRLTNLIIFMSLADMKSFLRLSSQSHICSESNLIWVLLTSIEWEFTLLYTCC